MARSWHDSVLDAVVRLADRTGDGIVQRARILADELPRIVHETESLGTTPDQTLSRVLQDLRDEGLVEFLGQGVYRVAARPVYVELAELPQSQLDATIRRGLLRLGQVETSLEVALTRRRIGQDRIRALTLASYSGRCALCDVADAQLLVASHIVAWAEDSDARGRLTNVICLCRFHDALFEAGYWSLSDSLTVLQRQTISSVIIRALLPTYTTFRRPIEAAPASEYLQRHRAKHGFGGPAAGA